MTNCPFCGGALAYGGMRLGYRVGRCGCGSVVCLDDVDDSVLAGLYGDPGYYEGRCPPYGYDGDFTRSDAHKLPLWEERLRAVDEVASGRRMLEVGPGMGGFARFARSRGWDVTGLDPYPAPELDLPVVESLDVAVRDGPFDAVCLFDVVEHLAEPSALLGQLAGALSTGGCLAIGAPNAGGGSFRALKFDWWEVRPPEHLSVPSHEGIRHLLDRTGFRLVRTIGHFRQTWHWPPVMVGQLRYQHSPGVTGEAARLGLRVANRVLREIRLRLPPPPVHRQDYVTWLAQVR